MNLDNGHPAKENIDISEVITSYTKHWKWFVLSVLFALTLAFLYLRYTIPMYSAEAKIKVLENKSSETGLDMFRDLDIFPGGKNNVEDEIELINSRSNFIEVVRELGLNVKIFALGNIKDTELYDNPPIKLNLIGEDSIINKSRFEFYVTLSSSTTFGYSIEPDEPVNEYAFGKNITTPIGDIVITPNMESIPRYRDKKIKVVITPVSTVAQQYQRRLLIMSAGEFSNILNIYLEDPVKQKARNIINSLIRVYNRNAIEDKKIIADRTSSFINDRIADISSSLSTVDQSAEELKTSKGLTDIASEANINLNVGATNQRELSNFITQLNIAASMQDIVEQQGDYEVLPANIGLSDPTIASTTSKYNELVLERNRLLKSSNEKNPVIVNLDQEINGLKQSMQASLSSTVNNLSMQVNTLSGQQAIINSKIYSSPKNERALRDITRRQQTTESLYLYLLQKREEAQIAVASTSPKCKIIDDAYNPSNLPVSPKRSIIFLASLILGMLIPFSVIYTKDLLDNKIHNKTGLEKLVKDIPVLGELPKITRKNQKLVNVDDRSVLTESLRILRTNLDYVINSKKNAGNNNVIFVTSSVSGEGKTFLASNLSMILANTKKKVLLVGADIRNPKLYHFFTGKNVDPLNKPKRNKDTGLTDYLYDDNLSSEDIIYSMLVHSTTFDVIYSGKIPPNPTELLMSNRMEELIRDVSEKYDYVIMDTAPLMVVTDTLLISKFADHTVYVTRAGITETKIIKFPLKLREEGKLNGLSFVVNDVSESNLGYGGKYGYGYGKSMKKWWKFKS